MAETYTGNEGTDALAAGYTVMDGTEDWRNGWRSINKTRDLIAALKAWVTTQLSNISWSSLTGKPSTFPPSAHGHAQSDISGLAAALGAKAALADVQWVQQGNMDPVIYNRTLGGSYRVAYIGADGLLGWVPSSRRHKKNIAPAPVDIDAVLQMQLVTFLYKVEVDTGREGLTQWGLIAEQLDELGLAWLVDYGDGDQPEGVRYERLALALLPVLQNLAARVQEIETHLDALGGDHASAS